MRRKIVAGNWKMNKTLQEGIGLLDSLVRLLENEPDKHARVEKIVIPPFTHIATFSTAIPPGTELKLGAQNCSSERKGAFTGEISTSMLKDVGAVYVLIGHSERRSLFHENNPTLASKMQLALEQGLTPIYCVGEQLAEREAGEHFGVIKKQISEVLFALDEQLIKKVVIAYEPVWAIGTGVTASTAQAQEMHQFIRGLFAGKYGIELSQELSILYGGSCNPANAKELFACADVDGGLIGGASLNAEDFYSIICSFTS